MPSRSGLTHGVLLRARMSAPMGMQCRAGPAFVGIASPGVSSWNARRRGRHRFGRYHGNEDDAVEVVHEAERAERLTGIGPGCEQSTNPVQRLRCPEPGRQIASAAVATPGCNRARVVDHHEHTIDALGRRCGQRVDGEPVHVIVGDQREEGTPSERDCERTVLATEPGAEP